MFCDYFESVSPGTAIESASLPLLLLGGAGFGGGGGDFGGAFADDANTLSGCPGTGTVRCLKDHLEFLPKYYQKQGTLNYLKLRTKFYDCVVALGKFVDS